MAKTWANRLGASVSPVDIAAGLATFMPKSDIYNWHATNTRRLQRSLGKAISGAGYSDHLILGDGMSSGLVTASSADYPHAWPTIMRNLLTARGIPSGGTGWVMCAEPSAYQDPRIVETVGTWTKQAQGYRSIDSASKTLTFTSDVAGTCVAVSYFTNSGGFTVSIDGGSAVTVTPAGGTSEAKYVVTGLANTTHTVAVTTTSSSYVFISGFQVYNTSGLRVHNVSGFGWGANLWKNSFPNVWPNRIWTTGRFISDPDVLHLPLGAMDVNAGRTMAQLGTDLTAIKALFPTSDVILYVQYQFTGNSWNAYSDKMYELADTFNCPLIDLYQRSGGYTAANANGLMGDGFFPNITAQAICGQLAASAILRAV